MRLNLRDPHAAKPLANLLGPLPLSPDTGGAHFSRCGHQAMPILRQIRRGFGPQSSSTRRLRQSGNHNTVTSGQIWHDSSHFKAGIGEQRGNRDSLRVADLHQRAAVRRKDRWQVICDSLDRIQARRTTP